MSLHNHRIQSLYWVYVYSITIHIEAFSDTHTHTHTHIIMHTHTAEGSSSTEESTSLSSAIPTSTGGASALFPCLVYYPGSNNYSLIWVPIEGANPVVSQAAAAATGGASIAPLWPSGLGQVREC